MQTLLADTTRAFSNSQSGSPARGRKQSSYDRKHGEISHRTSEQLGDRISHNSRLSIIQNLELPPAAELLVSIKHFN